MVATWEDSAPIFLMAGAGNVEQTVSVGIWYMPHNTRELTCNCIYKPLHDTNYKTWCIQWFGAISNTFNNTEWCTASLRMMQIYEIFT
jgi:hypothetical protein